MFNFRDDDLILILSWWGDHMNIILIIIIARPLNIEGPSNGATDFAFILVIDHSYAI